MQREAICTRKFAIFLGAVRGSHSQHLGHTSAGSVRAIAAAWGWKKLAPRAGGVRAIVAVWGGVLHINLLIILVVAPGR